MPDQSYLDSKYFVDRLAYNCPFCNRNHVRYHVTSHFEFDWSDSKKCHGYIVMCDSCRKTSMHLSFEEIHSDNARFGLLFAVDDIDSKIFYSQPTSFFVLDERIPKEIRELITECDGCLKMNFLTGASACVRKAIYELLVYEKAEGTHYQDRIKSLKTKYPSANTALFDILAHIQDMTSDKVHEQSWDKWNSQHIRFITEVLKSILHEIYVEPELKAERWKKVQQLREQLVKDKKASG